jgi:hypothetical protein
MRRSLEPSMPVNPRLYPLSLHMNGRLIAVVAMLLIAAIGLNLIVALVIALLAAKPPSSIADAQDLAARKLFRQANPTPPIWPEFQHRGFGITITGRNPDPSGSPTASAWLPDGESYMIVTLQVGWPFRILQAQTRYTAAGWTKPATVLNLPARPGPAGRMLSRDLPLELLWSGMLLNIAILIAVISAPCMLITTLRRRIRLARHRCPSCGYPIGISPVCTECGAHVN